MQVAGRAVNPWQEHARSESVSDQFKLDIDDLLSPWRKQVAPYAKVVLEARLLSLLVDETLTDEGRKKRISTVMNQVGDMSKKFAANLKSDIHRPIMTAAVNKVVGEK